MNGDQTRPTAAVAPGATATIAELLRFLDEVPAASGTTVHVERAGLSPIGASAGWLDLERTIPTPVNAAFRLASNTKTFAAATVIRLVEQDAFSLDDRIDQLLPERVIESWAQYQGMAHLNEITIRHLLQHTSGLPSPSSPDYMVRVVQEPLRRWSPFEQIELWSASNEPSGRPGGASRYSDTGYVVLALLIEHASGMPLAAAFRRLLGFDSLNLRSLFLESCEDAPPGIGPRIRQYLANLDVTDFDPSFDLFAAGGLVSDAQNLSRFWRLLFDGHVFSDQRSLDLMRSTVADADGDRETGLGVFNASIGGLDCWFHFGFFGSFALHCPAECVTIAGVVNQALSELPDGALFDHLVRLLATATIDA